ncbi:carboxymuconolactone decarboxylase family protein [Halomonas daqingensis]|uniref:Carboxymuconolactone decarboxylase family protein n=1 Tax=Billgrantia desiderata TaxID=52021 RepID=A0ABS9B367_9GAMM|nr:carboxymuconolactone decarboxylase family protein [Halomonas desiderata]MCE8041536.1 carboxymuconolactone decarboxylase family protein [Halomonas desiderata]MCE8046111.1 carboxymuconolactone decarboxylase family protein [Halomonas desiderata]
MTADYRIQLEPQNLDNADAKARPLLEKANAKLGFVPNMYTHMAKAPGVLDAYLHGYELFRQDSGFTPPEQEVVFLTVSRLNGCGYCMSAHSMLAEKASQVPAEVIDAIRNDREIPDEKLAALSRFTRVMFETRGMPGKGDVTAFLEAGYQETHILQIVLALAVKTLSNYANHLNHPELDEAFSGHAWQG